MKSASTKLVLALVVVSVMSVGCRREGSITAPPMSNRTLAGSVVPVGDLLGSSPAGINVSSQGQVAVTDGAGNFAFMSLPASSVQLTFSRADGINASASVSSSASAVVVQLQKTQASVHVSSSRGPARQLEGLIRAISETEITVDDASTGGPVTAKLDENTVIRKGNTRLQVSDLKVGDRVHVKASTNEDTSLTALEIKLQNPADDDGEGSNGGQTKQLEGLIVEVSETSITVNNASTGGPVTAAITSSTVIRKGNQRLQASDLKQGDRVHVKTSAAADGALTALEIMLQNPGR